MSIIRPILIHILRSGKGSNNIFLICLQSLKIIFQTLGMFLNQSLNSKSNNSVPDHFIHNTIIYENNIDIANAMLIHFLLTFRKFYLITHVHHIP